MPFIGDQPPKAVAKRRWAVIEREDGCPEGWLWTRIMPKARDSLRYSSPQDAALGDGPLFHFLLRSQTVRFRPRPTSAALRPCRSPACRGRHPESGQSIPGSSRPGCARSGPKLILWCCAAYRSVHRPRSMHQDHSSQAVHRKTSAIECGRYS